MAMRLRDLEQALQCVQPFDTKLQKIELEQFPTGWHIASRLISTASDYEDVENKVVVDLGTGTAMLGIGCAMMGAAQVVGLDADADALAVARSNIDELEVESAMDLVLCDVTTMPLALAGLNRVDTVIMNPPFGTRNKGIDVLFLERALDLRPKAIYSLHKSSTRKFLVNKATNEWGLTVEVLAELRFDIPKMYKMHKEKSKDVAVDFIRFELPEEMRAVLPPARSLPPAQAAEGAGCEDEAQASPPPAPEVPGGA